MTSAEIGLSGEQHVTADLVSKGYYCNRNTRLPGCTDIEATRGTFAVLVQVKTAVYPETPAILSTEEFKAITGRAKRKGWQAWLAQVQIDRFGARLGEINYVQAS
jgi:Holliday junction resolvase